MTAALQRDGAGLATEPAFAPQLSARWALRVDHLMLVILLSGVFLTVNYLPLRGTDLWLHVNLGQWIWHHGRLPMEDPFMPLARGMRLVDTAWLSQVIFAAVDFCGGSEALSHLFAVTTVLTLAGLARAFYLPTGSTWASLTGLTLVLTASWSRLATIRPENFAALCFALLLWLIVQRPGEPGAAPRRHHFWSIPLVMTAWANLHGSFLCGLALLGCVFVGRTTEAAWRLRSPRRVMTDASVLGWLAICQLAVIATLVNPYGVDLLLESLVFARNQNLPDVLEWKPLALLDVGGREFASAWVVLLIAFRHSRRRIPAEHALMLAVFGVAVVFGVRMLTWFGPVLAIVLVPHLQGLASRWRRRPVAAAPSVPPDGAAHALPPGRSWRISMVCATVVWIAFALSPASAPILPGAPRTPQQLYGRAAPLAATEYLRQHPPSGIVYVPQWWGDWLVRQGPPGLQPFVTSNIHAIPPAVWRDYLRLNEGRSGWMIVLDRYAINTLMIDKGKQASLVQQLRRASTWRIVFEDQVALIAVRTEHGPSGAAEDSSAMSLEPAGLRHAETPATPPSPQTR